MADEGIRGFLSDIETLGGPAGLLAGAFGAGTLAGVFFRRRFDKVKDNEEIAALKEKSLTLQADLDQARNHVLASRELAVQPARLWTQSFVEADLEVYSKTITAKILVVANLKGGVGKSTTAASLAAYFAIKHSMRTLLVDLDYQATSTTLVKTQTGIGGEDNRVGMVLQAHTYSAEHYALPIVLTNDLAQLSLLSSNPQLDEIENGMMFEVVLRRPGDPDNRLRLARYLRSPEVQSKFDLIILDTPPRLSAAAVNGLLAASHVLVPTRLEPSSTDATWRFCEKLRRLQQTGFPISSFLGVLPVMTTQRPNLTPNEIVACNQLDERLEKTFGQPLSMIRDAWAPNTTSIGSGTSGGIAYVQNATARAIFDDVGEAIRRRMF